MSAVVLAAAAAVPSPTPTAVPGGADPQTAGPGILAFFVFVALAVTIWFLVKSMNRHLGRVPTEDAVEQQWAPVMAKDERPAAAPAGAEEPWLGRPVVPAEDPRTQD